MELVFWAGAKTIAGTGTETWAVGSIAAALQAAADRRRDARFDRLLAVCTILVEGVVVHPDQLDAAIEGTIRAEILPPYAGGSE